MFSSLMSTRRFAPIFWCQFFSAFNDNLVKNALIMIIIATFAKEEGASLVTLGGRCVDGALLRALGARRPIGRPLRQSACCSVG